MRIVIINTLYAPNTIGGAEKSVQTLAESFVSEGYKVLVICLSENEDISYAINGVEIHSVSIKNRYWAFNNVSKNSYQKLIWHLQDVKNKNYDSFFKDIFLKFKPNILFTNNLSGFSTRLWTIAKEQNVKIVHTLRDYYLQCPKSVKFKDNKNCIKPCTDCKLLSIEKKRSSKKVDFLIGISEFVLNDHLKNGYFKGVTSKVIYNGFNVSSNIKNKININNEKLIVFGFIGQVKESKGIELLLKSLSKFENKDWVLNIAGNIEDNYLKKLKKINSSPKIKYLGYTKSDVFFNEIDVLIVPSLWNEPFGRVIIESLLNKTPVCGSNRGGISELLSNNRNFIFRPEEENLTILLERILSNKDFLKTFEFDNKFIEKFSRQKITESYKCVFNKVLNMN